MAHEVGMFYHLHMSSYFLGTFTEYPLNKCFKLLFEYIKEEIIVQESQPEPKDCNKRKTF